MKTKLMILSLLLTFSMSLSLNAQERVVASGQDNPQSTYRLYPTQNMWTFLELNTQDGRIWQVQYSIGDNNFKSELNWKPLVDSAEQKINGRFTLYPTQNMWNFILLDTIDGRTWQVQWSQDYENRIIVPITLL